MPHLLYPFIVDGQKLWVFYRHILIFSSSPFGGLSFAFWNLLITYDLDWKVHLDSKLQEDRLWSCILCCSHSDWHIIAARQMVIRRNLVICNMVRHLSLILPTPIWSFSSPASDDLRLGVFIPVNSRRGLVLPVVGKDVSCVAVTGLTAAHWPAWAVGLMQCGAQC